MTDHKQDRRGLFSWAGVSERPIVELILRWALGITFLVAALPKILDPMALARIIDGYALVPEAWIDPSAYILPWVEVAAAFSLIFGVFPRYGLYLINLLLLVFIVAISINVFRGHEFDCGCFSVESTEAPASPIWLLVRDALMLVIGLHLVRIPLRPLCLVDPDQLL
jgi:uncharacterized membrane protein YphA (DoxX/SURF4 family)